MDLFTSFIKSLAKNLEITEEQALLRVLKTPAIVGGLIKAIEEKY